MQLARGVVISRSRSLQLAFGMRAAYNGRETYGRKADIMRIAIPSETNAGTDGMRSGHFGHAPYFTVVTFDDAMNATDVEVVENVDHDAVGCGGVIGYVIGMGVDGVLAAGMGMRPLTRFTEAGMTVYSDTTEPNVGKDIELFSAGKVAPMDPSAACHH